MEIRADIDTDIDVQSLLPDVCPKKQCLTLTRNDLKRSSYVALRRPPEREIQERQDWRQNESCPRSARGGKRMMGNSKSMARNKPLNHKNIKVRRNRLEIVGSLSFRFSLLPSMTAPAIVRTIPGINFYNDQNRCARIRF